MLGSATLECEYAGPNSCNNKGPFSLSVRWRSGAQSYLFTHLPNSKHVQVQVEAVFVQLGAVQLHASISASKSESSLSAAHQIVLICWTFARPMSWTVVLHLYVVPMWT